MDTSYYVDTSYGYNAASASGLVGGMLIFMIIVWIIAMAASVLMIISMWKVFKKLGKPGWAAIVPFYNVYVLCCEIAEKQWWYILLLCVPLANIYAMYVIYDAVAKKFGKDTGYTIGMIFLPIVFFPMLAFSKNANPVQEDIYANENTQAGSINDATINNVNTLQNSDVENVDLEKTNISIGGLDGSVNDFTNLAGIGAAPVMPIQDNTVTNNSVNDLNEVNEIRSEPLSYGSTFNGDVTKLEVEPEGNSVNMAKTDGMYQAPMFDNNVEPNGSLNSTFDNTPDYGANLQNNYNVPINDINSNDALTSMTNSPLQENILNNSVNNVVETLNNEEGVQGFNEQAQTNYTYTSTVNNQNLSETLNSQDNINQNVTLDQNDNATASIEKQNNNDFNGGHTSLWSNNNQNNTQI